VVAGFAFGIGKFANVLVFRVMPAIALANLIDINVPISDVKAATVPSFAVNFDRIEADVFSVNLLTQAVSGRTPVGLSVLGRIDSVKVDSMPSTGFIEDGARIAVFNGDHPSSDRTMFNTPIKPIVRADGGRKAQHERNRNETT
jgi:hypothetical protein